MLQLNNISGKLENAKNTATDFLQNNLALAGAAVGGAALGTVVTIAATAKKSPKRSSKKRSRSRSKRKTSGSRKKRKYKYAYTARKGKDRSTRRIRQTKHGQPYIILKSGKARFIKKSSARLSRRRKGGRY